MNLKLHQGGTDDNAEAAAWVLRLSAPEADFAEFEAFTDWTDAAPGRAEAYDRALALWSLPLEDAAPVVTPIRARKTAGRGPVLWGGGLAAAASVAAALFFGAPWMAERYSTGPGEHREIALADGSHVSLNGASTLKVRWTRKSRQLDLAQGEAMFDVAKDASRPFIIHSGERTLRVVGTAFDVKARGDDLLVTVSRGVVEVKGDASAAPVRLTRGDQARFEGLGSPLLIVSVNPDEASSWREGRLIYRDAALGEVVQALNAQFGMPSIRVAASAARLRFSGVLMLDDRAEVVKRLTYALPLRVRRTPSEITLEALPLPAR